MIAFDEASHTYTREGQVVRSVTQTMRALRDFAGIPLSVLDNATERGGNVHLACQLDDDGRLDEDTVSDVVRPYLDAWRSFKAKQRPLWTFNEVPLYSKRNDFAGTPDRYGYVMDCEAVIEIKAVAELHPAFGVQLAGYKTLLEDNNCKVDIRLVVHLLPNGCYKLRGYDDALDAIVFASCLNINRWRIKNGC